MKIYVAGINTLENYSRKNQNYIGKDLNYNKLTETIINKMNEIRNDAVNLMGDDVITILVLQEYAFTSKAIANKDKKICLDKLEKAVKNYKNFLFVPGTFAAYELFSEVQNPEKRKAKIVENYNKHLNNSRRLDAKFMRDYSDAKNKFITDTLNQSICLQNSAYILSSDTNSHRIKHKKSYPWNEERLLSPVDQNKHLFYMGADSEVKNVSINNQQLDVGLTICREHVLVPSSEVTNNPPPIQIIVSASVDRYEDNLYGAANIHMDFSDGLSVHINDQHPKLKNISEIKAYQYELDSNSKKNIVITHFNKNIGSIPKEEKSSADTSRLMSSTKTNPATTTSENSGLFHKGFLNRPVKKSVSSEPKSPVNDKKTNDKKTGTDNNSHKEFGGLRKGFLR